MVVQQIGMQYILTMWVSRLTADITDKSKVLSVMSAVNGRAYKLTYFNFYLA